MNSTLLCAYVVFLVSAGIRFYQIHEPARIVFDEIVYGKFINWTRNREFFFDVFPPLGKLVLSGVSTVFGWNENFDFPAVGAAYPEDHGYAEVRAFNALFGAVTSMLLVLICGEAGFSAWSSTMIGMVHAMENLAIIQSRVIMADTLMMVLAELAVLFAFRAFRERRNKSNSYGVWLGLAGVWSGMALATKWTSFATPALVTVISYFGIPPFLSEGPLPLKWVGAFNVIIAASYFAVNCAFLMVVNHSGTGDAFGTRGFQAALVNNQHHGRISAAPIWSRVAELNGLMYRYQKGVRGNPGVEPSWVDWILNLRGSMYSLDKQADGYTRLIYLIMNPAAAVVINTCIGAMIVMIFLYVRYRRYTDWKVDFIRPALQRGATLIFAWLFSMLPTIAVYRCGPLYQYLPALLFAQIISAQTVDTLPPRPRAALCVLIVIVVCLSFFFWSPWIYAVPLTEDQQSDLKILSGWK